MKLNELFESIRNIDADVEYIYEKGQFQKVLNSIHKGNPRVPEVITIDSAELVTKECIMAHKVNPVEIICHGSHGDNHYSPNDGEILLNMISDVSDFAMSMGNPSRTAASMDHKMGTRLMSELSEGYYKGIIMHELAHWIDDSLNSRHLSSKSTRAYMDSMASGTDVSDELIKRLNKGKGELAEFSKAEIEGQVHTVAQVKRQMTQKQWDSLQFSDLINLVPILGATYDRVDLSGRDRWLRDLKSRLHREGLLGKRMR